MKTGFRIAIGLMLCLVLELTACGRTYGAVAESTDTAMGTIFHQKIYYTEDAVVDDLSETIRRRVEELETTLLSKHLETAQVRQINQALRRETGVMNLMPTAEFGEILDKCLEVSRASGGAFDITIGDVVELWDIDEQTGSTEYMLPSASEIADAVERCGYEKIEVGSSGYHINGEITFDLGAVGKGVALDEIHKLLQERENVQGVIISAGGSVLTYGAKEDGKPWKVAVVNPENPAEAIGYLTLEGQWCVSTSGDYERYAEVDGVRYHHIIDPATGCPADSGLRSVTIVSSSGLLSDALSTACFVLGVEQGMELVVQYDVEAIFVDTWGNITTTEQIATQWTVYES